MTPRVTIITVTYNCRDFVAGCLASLGAQTNCFFEHLVIDGASTDGTLDILNEHRSSITRLISERDRGVYDAMNKGIALASGDIIGFLNADDVYAHNQVLENVVEIFTDHPELDACYADLVYVKRNDLTRIVRYWRSGLIGKDSFIKGRTPPHPTLFIRRSVYERFGGFDLGYSIAADVELMIRLFAVVEINARYVPDIWVKMRVGGISGGGLRDVWRQNQEILSALKRHGMPVATWRFFANKLASRGTQYVHKPCSIGRM